MPDKQYRGNAPSAASAQKTPPEKTQNPVQEEDAGLKRRLMRHMAIAFGLIVVLLGLLWLSERFGASTEETGTDQPHFEKPVPVGKKTPAPQPEVKPQPELPTPSGQTPPGEESQPPQMPPAPPAAPTEQGAFPAHKAGMEASHPAEKETSSKKSSTSNTASSSQTVPPPPPPSVEARPQLPSGGERPAETGKPARPVQMAEPDRAEPEASADPALLPANLRTASVRRPTGYTLSAGTYLDAAQAEALQVALTNHGIPSTLETRVSIGPFKTRQEAEAARRKLKALGIDAPVVGPEK
ncbi:MAG: SPOR domain-containing protein [Betaproteobacteria bacterium]|nr:SPOR domain-containing protein [Betaproteobacteria bacterium]